MPTLPQSEKAKTAAPDKSEKILFRCSPELKRAVRIAAAEQGTSIEDLCADLIARGLKQTKAA